MAATWTVDCPNCGAKHVLCYAKEDVVPLVPLEYTCPKSREVVATPWPGAWVEVVQKWPSGSLIVNVRE